MRMATNGVKRSPYGYYAVKRREGRAFCLFRQEVISFGNAQIRSQN